MFRLLKKKYSELNDIDRNMLIKSTKFLAINFVIWVIIIWVRWT